MKNLSPLLLLIVALFLFNSCEKKVVENDFQSGLTIDLSDLDLDFSGMEIEFELLFEYSDKETLLSEADNMFTSMLKEVKDLIIEDEDVSHVLFSFKVANGKAKLKELLMYDSIHKTVNDYHNYTKKLGALDGISADEELLNVAFKAIAPENYVEIEKFESTANHEEQTQVFVNFLESNYQPPSDRLDFIVVVGADKVRAYAN